VGWGTRQNGNAWCRSGQVDAFGKGYGSTLVFCTTQVTGLVQVVPFYDWNFVLTFVDDHKVFPGIHIGDIGMSTYHRCSSSLNCLEGPKVMRGYALTDNGFARFEHVRIPKENMLSGFAQVTDDGQYLPPPHQKIGYGGVSVSPTVVLVSFSTIYCRCYIFVQRIYPKVSSHHF